MQENDLNNASLDTKLECDELIYIETPSYEQDFIRQLSVKNKLQPKQTEDEYIDSIHAETPDNDAVEANTNVQSPEAAQINDISEPDKQDGEENRATEGVVEPETTNCDDNTVTDGELCNNADTVNDKELSNETDMDIPFDEAQYADDAESAEPEGSISTDDAEEADEPYKEAKAKRTKFETKRLIVKICGKVISGILWIISLSMLFLCCSNLYQNVWNKNNYTGFFGIGNAVVSSDSMSPTLKVNDVVFYKAIDINTAKPDDIIVYKKMIADNNEERLIIHRVITSGNGYTVTQGDNNATADEAFPNELIVGKYIFRIAGVGKLLSLMSTAQAPFIVAAILIAIVALRVGLYFIKKKNIIKHMSKDAGTRKALDHFFDF